ncbi:hypothetical protein ACVGW6_02090, partial [Enterobacter intestinihominis]
SEAIPGDGCPGWRGEVTVQKEKNATQKKPPLNRTPGKANPPTRKKHQVGQKKPRLAIPITGLPCLL